jgi:hypothetical protein
LILFVLAGLGAVVVAFILYPVFARAQDRVAVPSASSLELARLSEQKEQVLSAIKDLDFEHAAGKLSEEDYQQVRADFLARAAEILTRQEELAGGRAPAAASAPPARETAPAVSEKTAAPPSAPAEEPLRPYCVACGQQNPEGARFCFRCGAKIETLPTAKRAVAAPVD